MRSVLVIGIWGMARHFFLGVERVVLNALANERGFAAGYLRLRRLLPSSSEKPIHLWLRLARDTRATTAVEAAVSAATI